MESEPSALPDSPIEDSAPTRSDLERRLQHYGNLLLEAATRGNDPTEVGPLHYSMGETHDQLGRYAEAEIHYRAAAHSFDRSENLLQAAQCWILAGELQALLGFSEAQASFEKAGRIGEELNNLPLQAKARYSLGKLKEFQADLDGALIEYQEALRLIQLADVNDPAVQSLPAAIVSSLTLVQIELIVRQALELAERINRSAERPPEIEFPRPSPPSQPDPPSRGLPGDPRASRWPRPRRNW